ncbi:MAG TPA: GNAT family protein [Acetobacteraceae bacterium]|jgi:ribosomal-protein-alanine N-acetyltransferase|nr:GNAT family protein [Acetobacteraceae bacterium]
MTSRITLTRATQADRTDMLRANYDSRAYHLPWVEPCTDDAGFDAWIARSLTAANVGLIARTADGRIGGVVNLNEIVMGSFQSAYLGYYGMAWCTGQGLMTEAVRLATRFAFDALGLHRVEANIQPDNTRSIALVRRLGFTREGFSPRYLRIAGAWRDHERWALLADAAPSGEAAA